MHTRAHTHRYTRTHRAHKGPRPPKVVFNCHPLSGSHILRGEQAGLDNWLPIQQEGLVHTHLYGDIHTKLLIVGQV